jgi:FkbM family methyltransferase
MLPASFDRFEESSLERCVSPFSSANEFTQPARAEPNMSNNRPAASFSSLTGHSPKQKVVEAGAYHTGDPVYTPLLSDGQSELIGFEPHPEAFVALRNSSSSRRTFFPHAVGDGRGRTLHICASKDMTSLFEPNLEVLNLFHSFPDWSRVIATESVQTVRLDDVAETAGMTFLQMDVQGAELLALQHAQVRLREALVLHLEVLFLPLYVDQPLFSDVEQFLRHRGYVFHCFFAPTNRIIQPMTIDGNIMSGLNQLVWADAVFVRDFSRLEHLDDRELLTMAAIMHDCYHSWDLTLRLLIELDRRTDGTLAPGYLAALRDGPGRVSELTSVA